MFSFGKQINRYQASQIIGNFFPSISDRLLNTLQLNDNLEQNEGNFELIRASVSQRSASLTVVPFTTAIDIKENRKYLKYIIPLFLVFLSIAVFVPHLFQQSTERVVNYSKEFKPVSPFQFNLLNKNLQIEEGDDLEVNLSLSGSQFPDKIYIVSTQGKFLMEKTSKIDAKAILKKIKSNDQFYFEANSGTATARIAVNVGQRERSLGREPDVSRFIVHAHGNSRGMIMGVNDERINISGYLDAVEKVQKLENIKKIKKIESILESSSEDPGAIYDIF